MDSVSNDYAKGTFQTDETPCVSLYQPTHRTHPDNQQDPIRFRNLVDSIEESLRKDESIGDVAGFLRPFRKLEDDSSFWNHTLDGLAVLASPSMFKVYNLQRAVPERAIVADSFHTKPLLRVVQSADQFQILALDRNEIALFQGNRDAIDELPLAPGVPETIEDALGEDLTEEHMSIRTYGRGARGKAMWHGSGAKKDEVDIDTERFFRAVDRAVMEHHSKPSGLPLLLAALPEYHGQFRKLSHNDRLMETALDVHPDSLSKEELRKRAWAAVEPQYLERLSGLIDAFHQGRNKDLASDDVSNIATAAVAGQVRTLLLDADAEVGGSIDTETGKVKLLDISDPHVDDLLDDLGELVLKMGGDVVIVPSDRMPTDSGAAATYRFAS